MKAIAAKLEVTVLSHSFSHASERENQPVFSLIPVPARLFSLQMINLRLLALSDTFLY